MSWETNEREISNSIPTDSKVIDSKIQSILKPLSNPIRQQILILLAKGPITYTEIFNLLNLESGSFYWHIKKMSLLVEQTEDKKYYLSEIGSKAYQLLYSEDLSSEQVVTPFWVLRFTNMTDKLVSIPQWIILQQIIIVLIITSLGFSAVNLIQIGSIPEIHDETSFSLTLITIIGSLGLITVLILLMIIIIEIRGKRSLANRDFVKAIVQLTFVNSFILFPGLFAAILILIVDNPEIGFNIFLIGVLVFISTVFTLVFTIATIISNFDYDYKTSSINPLVAYYPYLIVSFLIRVL